MQALVTGATGFLGRHVVKAALEKGMAVKALVRTPDPQLAGVEQVEGDLMNRNALASALNEVDVVLHLAGQVSRSKKDAASMHRVHVEGTRNLLCAMAVAKTQRLILASTSGTVGMRTSPGTSTEEDTPDFELLGKFPYYTSKLYQEQEVLRFAKSEDAEAVILNPSLLLGPGDDRMSSTEDVLEVLQGRVRATVEGTIAMVDVRDVAPIFIEAASKGRSGHRYLLNGANLSVRNFIQRVGVAGNVSVPSLRLPSRWAIQAARWAQGWADAFQQDGPMDPVSVEMSTLHWGVSAEKAERELGFSARDPQTTIRDTVRAFERKGLFRRRSA